METFGVLFTPTLVTLVNQVMPFLKEPHRLVDDLLLDDLLDDVLEGDEADRFVERIALAGSVDILNKENTEFYHGDQRV